LRFTFHADKFFGFEIRLVIDIYVATPLRGGLQLLRERLETQVDCGGLSLQNDFELYHDDSKRQIRGKAGKGLVWWGEAADPAGRDEDHRRAGQAARPTKIAN
jgi:hypothetical protein